MQLPDRLRVLLLSVLLLMKYYATLDTKQLTLTVIDEYCCEVLRDIIIPNQQRLTAAELKLDEYDFIRIGEWEQFANAWLIECERTTDDNP
jgi:hypothetical protein